jgi:hypothetical protein
MEKGGVPPEKYIAKPQAAACGLAMLAVQYWPYAPYSLLAILRPKFSDL